VDDISIIITSFNPINYKSSVNKVFQDINRWFTTKLLSLNVSKTQFMQFITKTSPLINLNTMHRNKKIVNTVQRHILHRYIQEKNGLHLYPNLGLHEVLIQPCL
jgi:hypothetical protein